MFRFLQNLSLQRKLMVIIMLTSSTALVVACAAFVIYDLRLLRSAMMSDLSTLAKVVGQMNTAALTFQDPGTARETLQFLRERKTIVSAALFGDEGKIISTYVREDVPPAHPVPAPQADGTRFNGAYLEVFEGIILQNERIGTIFIQSDLSEMDARIRQYVTILSVVILVSSAIALVLSSALQRIVSRPILSLAQTARAVSTAKNYSVRAEKYGSDELGELTDAFNEMLKQIAERDTALQAGRDQLERRVEERTHELQQEVAERQRAEMALRLSEVRFRSLIQSANDAIVVTDDRGGIILWNKGAQSVFGYSEAEALGQPVTMILPTEGTKLLGAGNLEPGWVPGQTREVIGCRKDKSEVPVEISATIWESGGVRFCSAIIRDMTERKEAVQKLQEVATKLERSNRELQDFAYVASHDLQEPLRKVQAFGDRLKAKFAPQLAAEGADYLDRMQNAARRMQNLINDLLLFSRVATKFHPFEPVDLGKIVREVLSDLEVRLQQTGGTVEAGDLPTLDADPSQMRQLLQNLISNALKFHAPGQPPVVKVFARNGKPQLDGGPVTCELCVQDNGIGFEEKYLDRIFAVFQRLHGRTSYEGTGIGLAICRKIVERHRGGITARSTPGEGSIFIVTLPMKQHNRGDS